LKRTQCPPYLIELNEAVLLPQQMLLLPGEIVFHLLHRRVVLDGLIAARTRSGDDTRGGTHCAGAYT
jgi:hypothetical protein